MDFLEIFKNMFSKDNKKMTNLIIILIIGMILLIGGGSIFGSNKTTSKEVSSDKSSKEPDKVPANSTEQIEKRLENILSQIEGVGKVSVMVTFESGTSIVPAMNNKTGETTTEEKDTSGGNRKISQNTSENTVLMMGEQGGGQKPLVLKELEPDVKGVIVAAEGAQNYKVKMSIYDAVKTALGTPAHKVQIFVKQK